MGKFTYNKTFKGTIVTSASRATAPTITPTDPQENSSKITFTITNNEATTATIFYGLEARPRTNFVILAGNATSETLELGNDELTGLTEYSIYAAAQTSNKITSTVASANATTAEAILSSNWDLGAIQLTTSSTLPSSPAQETAFHPNNTLFASIYSAGGVKFYEINPATNTFDEVTSMIDITPSGTFLSIDFSSDGNYLVIGTDTSPNIFIYKYVEGTYIKLTNPTNLPADDANGVSFSENANYLAVGHVASPYLTVYQRSGDTFTKIPDPAVLPAETYGSFEVEMSKDGSYIFLGGYDNMGYIYKLTGTTLNQLKLIGKTDDANAGLYDTSGYGFALRASFNEDASLLAFGGANYSSNHTMDVYKRAGDTFTLIPKTTTTIPADGLGGGWQSGLDLSLKDPYFVKATKVNDINVKAVAIYKINGDVFTEINIPFIQAKLQATSNNTFTDVFSVNFSNNSEYLIVSARPEIGSTIQIYRTTLS